MVMNFAEACVPFYVIFKSEGTFQLAEKARVVAPVLMDADVEVEMDFRPEDRLQLLPRLGADAFDHHALLPEDDPLLRIALDEDRGPDADEVRLLVLLEAIHVHGRGIRQLL